jgi:hypothetical protein
MPRKKDGIPFVLYPRPTKGEDGKPLLYARPEPGRKLSQGWIDDLFTHGRTYSHGDFIRMMETFIELVGNYIADGYRVETPLGSFAPKLRTLGDYTRPEEVTSGAVAYAGIEFQPSKAFAQEVLRHQRGCHRVEQYQPHADGDKQVSLDEALKRSLRRGFTTVKIFQAASGKSYKVAKSYLDSLCEGDSPQLRRYKIGTALHYEPIAQPQSDKE